MLFTAVLAGGLFLSYSIRVFFWVSYYESFFICSVSLRSYCLVLVQFEQWFCGVPCWMFMTSGGGLSSLGSGRCFGADGTLGLSS